MTEQRYAILTASSEFPLEDRLDDLRCPVSIRIEDLKNFMDSSLSRKKILILDRCYSGVAGDSFIARGDIQEQLKLISKGQRFT